MIRLKLDSLTIGVNINMQEFYDNLVVCRKGIDAQIKALGEDPSICTHVRTEDLSGITCCANAHCRKVISTNGLHDWAI